MHVCERAGCERAPAHPASPTHGRLQDRRDHGCFHVLMDRNTGVLFVRNTSVAVATMQEWKVRTSDA